MQSKSEPFPERSLDTLRADLKAFHDSGGDIKTAKMYNNVIHEHLFNVELSQV